MDIASLSTTAAAARLISSRANTQSDVDPAAQALQNADRRVQKQRDSVSVQLSAFGQIKSSF